MIIDNSSLKNQLNKSLEDLSWYYEMDCAYDGCAGFKENILKLQTLCKDVKINDLIKEIERLNFNLGENGCVMLCDAHYIVQGIEDVDDKKIFIDALINLKQEKGSNPDVQKLFDYAIENCNLELRTN